MERVVVFSPPQVCDAQIAIAARRAGALGVLDLGDGDSRDSGSSAQDHARRAREVGALCNARAAGRCGLRWDAFGLADAESFSTGFAAFETTLRTALAERVDVLVLGGLTAESTAPALSKARALAREIRIEVHDPEGARAAEQAGCDGLIVRGNECGGDIGPQSSFILAQRLCGELGIPYWIQGGIGVHTAGAIATTGATGIALCEQLWLTEEAPFGESERDLWRRCDGADTVEIRYRGGRYRVHGRLARAQILELQRPRAAPLEASELRARVGGRPGTGLVAAGQDLGSAARLAAHCGTVGRVVAVHLENWTRSPQLARRSTAFAPGSLLASEHGTRYPIVQGPMTRVSDRAPFAKAVALAGALPFLAVSVLREEELRRLLLETREALGELAWGVGILGFVPPALRREQLRVIAEFAPSFCILSGGTPRQAMALEKRGISTYLHVPSPELLERFITEGARKFILEGRECGGHVGPRSSFVLWNDCIDRLLATREQDLRDLRILLAGGIHDARSAAMAATVVAPLCEAGVKAGVLMGSAYLFTEEASEHGAITDEFQRQVLACRETTLLESGPGYATRCASSRYCEEFERRKSELLTEGKKGREVLEHLERLNVGRLRIATKGVSRAAGPGANAGPDGTGPARVAVDLETQLLEGLFMLGEVGTMKHSRTKLEDLHRAVTLDAQELLDRFDSVREVDAAEEALPGGPSRAASGSRATVTASAGLDSDKVIAIVGMACLFPGSSGLRQFWHNIVSGKELIREVPAERWRTEDYFDPDRTAPDRSYSKWGGFLDDVFFDPTRYGIPPTSVPSIEPMQLLALEVARRALEDAGFDRLPCPRSRTAVIFGAGGVHDLSSNYTFRTLLAHYLPRVEWLSDATRSRLLESLRADLPEWTEDSFPGVLGNVASGRIANRFDLGGPNFTVDAACASSLAALDAGIKELRLGRSDVVVVGAGDGANHPVAYQSFSSTQALSPRGRSQPFDHRADGIVISEGIAVLVLKRLALADRDGDSIYALIRGIGSSSDGRHRSLTAPHPDGQERALRRAYADSGVDPSTIGLIEAHGTGTVVGDRTEVESLDRVFRHCGEANPCALGSVKSQIGHTKVAAGFAGLIKAVLALQQQILPPTAGIEAPNPCLREETSFYLNTRTRPWFRKAGERARRAGVSAFGFGGTNFHCVLEEHLDADRRRCPTDLGPRPAEILAFSRATPEELAKHAQDLLLHLESCREADLAAVASAHLRDEQKNTANGAPRSARLAIVATSLDDLRQQLRSFVDSPQRPPTKARGLYFRQHAGSAPLVCFLFPGQGSQRVDMLVELVGAFPFLRATVERADRELEEHLESPLSSFIFPRPAFDEMERLHQHRELNGTRVAQPALGLASLLGHDLLRHFGLVPDFAAGHSYGEYPALHAAGVLTAEAMLQLSARRGRICDQAAANGATGMATVGTSEERARDLLREAASEVEIACVNADDRVVIAGPVGALERAVAGLREAGIEATRLSVSAAFHSSFLADVATAIGAELGRVPWARPTVPAFSNTGATCFPDDPAAIRSILSAQLTHPVRFAEEVRAIYARGARVFVEVGPGRVLTDFVRRVLRDRPHEALALDRPGDDSLLSFAHFCGRAYALGLPVDLPRWFENRGLEKHEIEHARQAPGVRQTALAQVIERATRDSVPGPTVWRVNAGRAIPAGPVVGETAASRPHSRVPVDNHTDATTAGASRTREHLTSLIELQRKQIELTEELLRTLTPGAAEPTPTRAPGDDPEASQRQLIPRLRELRPLDVAPAPTRGARATPGGTRTPERLPTREEFEARLLASVAQRTGYPESMLDLEADLEADLGIDSIKRLEIISAMEELHWLRQRLRGPDDEGVIDELGALRSLREIADWYARSSLDTLSAGDRSLEGREFEKPTLDDQNRTPEQPASRSTRAAKPRIVPEEGARRYALRAVPAPLPATRSAALPAGRPWLIVDADPEIGAALARAMEDRGHRAVRVTHTKDPLEDHAGSLQADLSSESSVLSLRSRLHRRGIRVGGVLSLLGCGRHERALDPIQLLDSALRLFCVVKAFEDDLRESTKLGGGRLINVTNIDGKFGLAAGEGACLTGAGTLGVAKTLARERPKISVRCLDIDADVQARIGKIIEELEAGDVANEIGLAADGRWSIELREEAIATKPSARVQNVLEPGSVVLVTGGAYGVTAQVAKELASCEGIRLILVGRSPLPSAEPRATQSFADAAGLRRHLIDEAKTAGEEVSPATVERRLRQILKDREIRSNLATMTARGARIQYRSVDVRHAGKFTKLVRDLYLEHGAIHGVIHGAGINEDRPIRQKGLASFARVFRTKVTPACVLANELRSSDLRFLILFSSVASRFGNHGQVDYSAANEVLNKIADWLHRQWPSVKVVAIGWGPWQQGMVGEELRELYASQGIDVISVESGVDRCIQEMTRSPDDPAEILITRSLDRIAEWRLRDALL